MGSHGIKIVRRVFQLICALVLIAALAQVLLSTPAHAAEAYELESKRQALVAKEREIEEREKGIKERERELDAKIAEMERMRAAVTGELEAQRKNNEERVVKMVGVFEAMTPKSAAAVFETLDEWLAVDVLKRMDLKRVAKIMNIMDKSRSAKLSELMTGYYNPKAERKTAGQAQAQSPVEAPKAAPAVATASSSGAVDSQKKGGGK